MGCIKLSILDEQYKNTELKANYFHKGLTQNFYATKWRKWILIVNIDPNGGVVIFINGYTDRQIRGNREAWHAADEIITKRFGETYARYYNGGSLLKLSASSRMRAGEAMGYSHAAEIFADLEGDESIKIVTHSMGAAYGKGFIKGLQKYAQENNIDMDNLIEIELDLNPWQPKSQKAVKGIPTIDAPNTNDSWAGQQKMEGADYKPYSHQGAKPSIGEHGLDRLIEEDVEKLIQPSTRNHKTTRDPYEENPRPENELNLQK